MLKNPANNIQKNEFIVETSSATDIEKLFMQIREFTGYHTRKDHHLNSAVNLDHHNMKATNQYMLH